MSVQFEPMHAAHAQDVMAIFNDYVENSFAAYPDTRLPVEAYGRFMQMTQGYPAYVLKRRDSGEIIGFCFLHPYNPFPTFRETAEITYFIEKGEVHRGIGSLALAKLECDARQMGIKHILANISSENAASLNFHRKHGFSECGRFHGIGQKRGRRFDVVWMEKEL